MSAACGSCSAAGAAGARAGVSGANGSQSAGMACAPPPMDGIADEGAGPGANKGDDAVGGAGANRSNAAGDDEGGAIGAAGGVTAGASALRRTPGSQLLLKAGGLDQSEARERLFKFFVERGIEPQRLVLEGWSPLRELLASYNRVDLALDTQPYSGGLTTCEALWMGVPVVTFPRQSLASRHSTSYLANAGCEAFVAADLPGYIELATGWAGRPQALAEVRRGLRQQLRESPVCDAPRFARDLLAVLRQEYERRAALATLQGRGA